MKVRLTNETRCFRKDPPFLCNFGDFVPAGSVVDIGPEESLTYDHQTKQAVPFSSGPDLFYFLASELKLNSEVIAERECLFDGVGIGCELDHVAIEIIHDGFELAKLLFLKLGFVQIAYKEFKGGKLYTMARGDATPIQLFQLTLRKYMEFDKNGEAHIALSVADPKTVSEAIGLWAKQCDQEVKIEPGDDEVFFVALPGILSVWLELKK